MTVTRKIKNPKILIKKQHLGLKFESLYLLLKGEILEEKTHARGLESTYNRHYYNEKIAVFPSGRDKNRVRKWLRKLLCNFH